MQMGPLQQGTHTGRDGTSAGLAQEPRRLRITGPPDAEADGRHEPQSLIERSLPRDPYAAWLERHEAELERERRRGPRIRWVNRPRGPSAAAIAAAERERRRGPKVRWVSLPRGTDATAISARRL